METDRTLGEDKHFKFFCKIYHFSLKFNQSLPVVKNPVLPVPPVANPVDPEAAPVVAPVPATVVAPVPAAPVVAPSASVPVLISLSSGGLVSSLLYIYMRKWLVAKGFNPERNLATDRQSEIFTKCFKTVCVKMTFKCLICWNLGIVPFLAIRRIYKMAFNRLG